MNRILVGSSALIVFFVVHLAVAVLSVGGKRGLIIRATALFFASPLVLAAIGARAAEYTFVNIADGASAAPLGAFKSFSLPSISGNNVTFRGEYFDPAIDVGESGIFVGRGGPLTTIVKPGDLSAVGVIFQQLSLPTISVQTVAFSAMYRSSNDGAVRVGVFTGEGGPLTAIAKSGDITPSGTIIIRGQSTPAIDGAKIAPNAEYPNDKSALLVTDGATVTSIVTSGDPAPTGTFRQLSFSEPAISGSNVAFRGGYIRLGVGFETGIFTGSGGSLTTIAKTGDVAPSGVFSSFGVPSISEDVAAFYGSYTGGAGIFTGSGGPLTAIAKSGDAIPSLGTFTIISSDSIAISGNTVAFQARFGSPIQYGIFLATGGSLSPLIKTGDPLFGSVVTTLNFGRFGIDPEGSGNIAFSYQLGDGRSGVALANPVPEPSSLALLAGIAIFTLRSACGKHKRLPDTV